MYSNADTFGYDLPPGVTQQMIDAAWGGDEEEQDEGDDDPREDPHYDY